MCSLALVDGVGDGWTDVLLDPNEYLHDLPRITGPATFLRTFTGLIAFAPDVDGTAVWTTHGAGHVALLALSGVVAALLADVSALPKAETERIWLTFGLVAFSGTALLGGRTASWALVGSAASALLVNHLLDTGW